MEKKYLVIADDFTGAAESALFLNNMNIPTKLMFNDEIKSTEYSYVVDTESRAYTSEEALALFSDLVNKIDFSSFDYIYKKIDSTLRGNLVVEVQAIIKKMKPEHIVFAPASPITGRQTIEGIQHINHRRLLETELKDDPVNPVSEDNILELAKNFGTEIAHYSLEELASLESQKKGVKVHCFDAVTNEDMKSIVQLFSGIDSRRILWIGSPGLINCLASNDIDIKPSLGVVGSVSTISRNQISYAFQKGKTGVYVDMLAVYSKESLLDSYQKEVIRILKSGQDVIIYTCKSEEDKIKLLSFLGTEIGLNSFEISAFIQGALSKLTKRILLEVELSGILLSGGETALALIKELSAKSVTMFDEVEQALPMMYLNLSADKKIKIVTKAGAVGSLEAVNYALDRMKYVKE